MPRIAVLCLLAVALALVGGSGSSQASTRDEAAGRARRAHRRLRRRSRPGDQAAIAAKAGGKLKHEFKEIRAAVRDGRRRREGRREKARARPSCPLRRGELPRLDDARRPTTLNTRSSTG